MTNFKKIVFILFSIVFIIFFIKIKTTNKAYKQLTPYISIKTNTIQKENENTINAWFKIINQEENKTKYR